jgi:orotate phosphoribosyltransferase-like protein
MFPSVQSRDLIATDDIVSPSPCCNEVVVLVGGAGQRPVLTVELILMM